MRVKTTLGKGRADWTGECRVMDVACSTLCFTSEPLERALRHIAELEFSKVDFGISDDNPHVSITDVMENMSEVVRRIRQGPTIGFAAVTARLSASGDELCEQVDAVAHLAKQLASPIVVVDAGPAGSPFDEEVQRLTRLEKAVSLHGSILTVSTKTGTLTEDPDVAVRLCEQVEGLGLTLDPSHYICGPLQGRPFDQVFPHVKHTHLRDTGRRMDQLQVKVGRGEVEYGRIVTFLKRYHYTGVLAVSIEEGIESDLDVEVEVRKLRLVLESLI
jgi:sugar phosphate isomerase/epimerase